MWDWNAASHAFFSFSNNSRDRRKIAGVNWPAVGDLAVGLIIGAIPSGPIPDGSLTQALARDVKLGRLKLSIPSSAAAATGVSILDNPAYSRPLCHKYSRATPGRPYGNFTLSLLIEN